MVMQPFTSQRDVEDTRQALLSLAAQEATAEPPLSTAKRVRLRSAQYVPRVCREQRPGGGGTPLPTSARSRPASTRLGVASYITVAAKTERWRESGEVRWPAMAVAHPAAVFGAESLRPPHSGGVPFRRHVPEYTQANWTGDVWMRSLRMPGVQIQEPIYAMQGANMKDLHEEWQGVYPMSAREVPFSGSTSTGRTALLHDRDAHKWVERPVAVGKYALDHMHGNRYQWDMKTPAGDERPIFVDSMLEALLL